MKIRKATTRKQCGAVMAETVLIMPFLVTALMLIVYLGWNFRRLAQVTNMDRYAVWVEASPGSTGPGNVNGAFFGLNGDTASEIEGAGDSANYTPRGHRELQDQQIGDGEGANEYLDEFLERNPLGIGQRFSTRHTQRVNTQFLGLGNQPTRNAQGHSRMDGDWRYVREQFLYTGEGRRWSPSSGSVDRRADGPGGDPRPGVIDLDTTDGRALSYYHVSPAQSLNEVFFTEIDQGLESYENDGNALAEMLRQFYRDYPEYRSPNVSDPVPNTGGSGTQTSLEGGGTR